jgi:hypothetical protein
MQGALPALRSALRLSHAERVLTAKSACLRCTTVDFERPTSDEAVVEARRDALPAARWEALEYAVHGKFRMREGGVSFPDTFWYSLKELRTAGCSRANLRAAVGSYEEEMAAASENILCDMSDSEAEEESEDDLGSDGAEVGAGQGGAAEAEAEAEAEAGAVTETVQGTVPLPPIFGGGP